MASVLDMKKLMFWIDKRYNVLFEGKHGTGKTLCAIESFKKSGLRWLYFSASTMDPFIDFVGVPIKVDVPNAMSYIELIRPKHILDADPQIIMMDEFNRANKKVRNAVMELIQFGTINGRPLSKDGTRPIIWAAVNPDSKDGENNIYDTDRLDPAQKDRFHINIQVPYECDDLYFINKYGDQGKVALEFWRALTPVEKDKVSPRRLDYAVEMFKDGADLRDILPLSSNPKRLATLLSVGSAEAKLQSLMKENDTAVCRSFLKGEENYTYAIKTILSQEVFKQFFLPLLPEEKIVTLFSQDKKAKEFMINDLKEKKHNSSFYHPLNNVVDAETNLDLANIIKNVFNNFSISIDKNTMPIVKWGEASDIQLGITKQRLFETLEMLKTKSQLYYRKKAYTEARNNSYSNLPNDTVLLMLDVLDKCCKGRAYVIDDKMDELIGVYNFCILQLINSGMSKTEVDIALFKRYNLRRYISRKSITVDSLFNYYNAKSKDIFK